jgi:hypothetical protein
MYYNTISKTQHNIIKFHFILISVFFLLFFFLFTVSIIKYFDNCRQEIVFIFTEFVSIFLHFFIYFFIYIILFCMFRRNIEKSTKICLRLLHFKLILMIRDTFHEHNI